MLWCTLWLSAEPSSHWEACELLGGTVEGRPLLSSFSNSSGTISLGCDCVGEHQARHWQEGLLCHQGTPHPHQCPFWLPHSAFLCGMHGRALLTVEHLWERFEVLQRSHHPKQGEELIYVGTGYGEWCSGKQKATLVKWFRAPALSYSLRIWDTSCKENTAPVSEEMLGQSGSGSRSVPYRLAMSPGQGKVPHLSRVLQAAGAILTFICLSEGAAGWATLSFGADSVQRVTKEVTD